MKHQALFSLKDKSKKLNCHLLQFLFGAFRPDFTSKLVQVLAFGTPKFYIAPYDKIKHELVNLSSNCDVKSGLRVKKVSLFIQLLTPSQVTLFCDVSRVKTIIWGNNYHICNLYMEAIVSQ